LLKKTTLWTLLDPYWNTKWISWKPP
jgi:hypothetical protein